MRTAASHVDDPSDSVLAMSATETVRYDLAIIGLGTTGLSCVRYGRRRGLRCLVADTRAAPPLLAALRDADPDVDLITGDLPAASLLQARQVVLSPGLPIDLPALEPLRAAGIPIVGDIELFLSTVTAPVIAISGSNGKSTVTTLVAELLRGAGFEVRAGGNLGPAALDLVQASEPDFYVLELSSFQLERTPSMRSEIAALLNISPDHMDRHASLDDYARIKRHVFHGARTAVLNRDDPLMPQVNPGVEECRYFTLGQPHIGSDYGVVTQGADSMLVRGDEQLLPGSALAIHGMHNVANALAACAIVDTLGVSMATMRRVLAAFSGLAHRCQHVACIGGVDWYNDSKGTNVGATSAAVQGLFADRSGVLIAGGQGKNADFSGLAALLVRHVHAVVLLGEDARRIRDALPPGLAAYLVGSMREAVHAAARLARPGDAVLLSPACASFDMFENYLERGDVFTQAVRDLAGS